MPLQSSRLAAAALLILAWSAAPTLAQKTLKVPSQYPSIQKAIDAAGNGDTVLVAAGTYYETLDVSRKTNFTLKSSDGPLFTTVNAALSTLPVIANSAYSGHNVTVDGFTLTNSRSGGVVSYGDMTITNNRITVNVSTSSSYAGGITSYSNCTIVGNEITHNKGPGGGGIALWGSRTLQKILGNRIAHNQSLGEGGGLHIRSNANVFYNVIEHNSAVTDGGGVAVPDAVSVNLSDNVIAKNVARHGGGLAAGAWAYVTGGSNTIADNTATGDGGGLIQGRLSTTLTNTIFWNNKATRGPQAYVGVGGKLNLSYTVVTGGQFGILVVTGGSLVWGTGMANANPLFVDAARDDYHLRADSPYLDKGDSKAAQLRPNDFEGDPRLAGSGVDIGADEFHAHLYALGAATPGGTVEVKFIGKPKDGVIWGVSLNPRLRTPPLAFPGVGLFALRDPFHPIPLGPLSALGTRSVPVSFPKSFPVPWAFPLQALIGSKLSNVEVVNVR